MNKTFNNNILICYSNPQSTERLRLDKEHRVIDQILKERGADRALEVQRLHASTIEDIVHELQRAKYTIIQFSGHGSSLGIFLESEDHDRGYILSAEQLAELLCKYASNLQLLLCVSCFSFETLPILIDAAPYLITVSGATSDEAAIEFVRLFYQNYFGGCSIRKAYELAMFILDVEKVNLNACLSRRATFGKDSRILFEVFGLNNIPSDFDSFCVDVTTIEQDLAKLRIDKDKFISTLTRKIRIHKWIFQFPREHALLQLGSYLGMFSWQNAADVITCEKILLINPDTDDVLCEIWGGLLVAYNDHYVDKYRLVERIEILEMSEVLGNTIQAYRNLYENYFGNIAKVDVIHKAVPLHFKVSKSFFAANLLVCEEKHRQGDHLSTIVYLESMLSSLHDLVDALTEKVTIS